jgi:hypothetical protein
VNYLKQIATLPFPTVDKIQRFKEHLVQVHSWYKHLPLSQGATFIIYLEPNLDREYPLKHPALPFGNSKEGYQKAFGHLYYRYRIDGHWYEDYSTQLVNGKRKNIPFTPLLTANLSRWSTTLYPYCHQEFEEGISLFEEELQQIIQGQKQHPQAELLIHWYHKRTERENYWNDHLNESDRDFLVSIDDQQDPLKNDQFPPKVVRFMRLEQAVWQIEEELQKVELQKIDDAINCLLQDVEQHVGH